MTTTDDDVKELVKEIHAERVAAKEKERREGWTRYVSLMIVVLAVATAIGSLKAGGFGSKVILYQAQASDTWAIYQAKSVKQRRRAARRQGRRGRRALRSRGEGRRGQGQGARARARRGRAARPAAGLRDREPADLDRARVGLPHHEAQRLVGGRGLIGRDRRCLPGRRPVSRLIGATGPRAPT